MSFSRILLLFSLVAALAKADSIKITNEVDCWNTKTANPVNGVTDSISLSGTTITVVLAGTAPGYVICELAFKANNFESLPPKVTYSSPATPVEEVYRVNINPATPPVGNGYNLMTKDA